MSELSDRDRQILELERRWFRNSGLKEQVVRDRFDMSMTRYTQILMALLERPEAEAWDPTTVRRLQRLRDRRAAARSASRLRSA